MDFVGFAPVEALRGANFTAAKLIQKTVCNIFKEWVE
jgi:hypothetical protein